MPFIYVKQKMHSNFLFRFPLGSAWGNYELRITNYELFGQRLSPSLLMRSIAFWYPSVFFCC